MFRHGSDKLGAWNTKDGHWHRVKGDRPRDHEALMARNGFRWMTKSNGHCWWQLDGDHNADSFRAVVEALTGVPFRR